MRRPVETRPFGHSRRAAPRAALAWVWLTATACSPTDDYTIVGFTGGSNLRDAGSAAYADIAPAPGSGGSADAGSLHVTDGSLAKTIPFPDASVGGELGGASVHGAGGGGGRLGTDGGEAGSLNLAGAAAADGSACTSVTCGGYCPPCNCVWSDFGDAERIEGLGLDGALWAPSLSQDGHTLYLAATTTGDSESVFVATRTDRGAAFSSATPLEGLGNQGDRGSPFLSFDGSTLYFYATRPEGVGGRDIWYAARTSAGLSPPALLPNVNGSAFDHLPWVSRDNRTLLFSSNRSGGPGSADIFIATRATERDAFSPPTRLPGPDVDSPANDDRAVMSSDGLTLYFASNRPPSQDFDIWMATRKTQEDNFATAKRIERLNSPAEDVNVSLSWDESELFFSSSRGDVQRIWRSVRHCQ